MFRDIIRRHFDDARALMEVLARDPVKQAHRTGILMAALAMSYTGRIRPHDVFEDLLHYYFAEAERLALHDGAAHTTTFGGEQK